MESAVGSKEPFLEVQQQFPNYRREMLIWFDRYFPDLSGALVDIKPNQGLNDLELGDDANPHPPGDEPEPPAPNAGDNARSNYQINWDRWDKRNRAFKDHHRKVKQLCGFIAGTLRGDAKLRCTFDEDFNAAYDEKDWRLLWKTVLELYSNDGMSRAVQLRNLQDSLLTIKMGKTETLTQYQARFGELHQQLEDLGESVSQGVLVTSFINGLSSGYTSLKEHIITLEEVPTLHKVKRLADNWPTQVRQNLTSSSDTLMGMRTMQTSEAGYHPGFFINKRMTNQQFKKLSIDKQNERKEHHRTRISNYTCNICGIKGHIARQCDSGKQTGVNTNYNITNSRAVGGNGGDVTGLSKLNST